MRSSHLCFFRVTGSLQSTLCVVLSLLTILGSAALGQDLSPNPLTFSNLGVGSQSPTKFVRLGSVNAPVHISSVTVSGDFHLQSNDCGNILPPWSTCHLGIDFAPTMLGPRTGMITVNDDAPNSPQTAVLKGTGVPPVTITPASFTFKDELSGSNSSYTSFSIVNNSSISVNVSSEGTTGDFQIVHNYCGVTVLQPYNGLCEMDVRFSPTQTGKRTGTLVINDDAPNSPQAANLSGNSVTINTLRQGMFTGLFPLNTDREVETITLLDNGKVLVAGGQTSEPPPFSSAELYDPSTGAFSYTGNLTVPRSGAAATLLPNGRVLITGGYSGTENLSSAELYDPVSGTFSATGSMTVPRAGQTSTLLSTGQVLIAGGDSANNRTAELYDPNTGTFAPVGNLNVARAYLVATLLNSGEVLMTGGYDNSLEAELYDPATQTFTATGQSAASVLTATLMNNGKVLLIEGLNNIIVQIYDPVANTFASTGNLTVPLDGLSAALLTSGSVIVVGSPRSYNHPVTLTTQLYNPVLGSFRAGPATGFNQGGFGNTVNVLANAEVLVINSTGEFFKHDAEIYTPTPLTPANLVSITVTPANDEIPAGSAQRFIATGKFSDNSVQQLSSVIWTSSNPAVSTIANDIGSRGWAFGVSPGAVTITARAGGVSGSTTLTIH